MNNASIEQQYDMFQSNQTPASRLGLRSWCRDTCPRLVLVMMRWRISVSSSASISQSCKQGNRLEAIFSVLIIKIFNDIFINEYYWITSCLCLILCKLLYGVNWLHLKRPSRASANICIVWVVCIRSSVNTVKSYWLVRFSVMITDTDQSHATKTWPDTC